MLRRWSWGVLVALLLCGVAMAAPPVQVQVDGQPVLFDQPPVMIGPRVFVPLRGVFERLGATVVWDAVNHRVNATRGQSVVSLTLGQRQALVNGQPRYMDSPPLEMGGRVLVPLRFVSEAMGAQVSWVPSRWLVMITSGVAEAPPPQRPVEPRRIIRRVEVNTRGPVPVGGSFQVVMQGAEGGQATFDVGRVRNMPMLEGPAGTYRATYTVRATDRGEVDVRCRLRLADGRVDSREANHPVALGEPGRPQGPRLIASVVHNATTTLFPGQVLQVTLTGIPNAIATFDVGAQRHLPMTEIRPGTYVGRYIIPPTLVPGVARVDAHLRLVTGQQQTERVRPDVQIGVR
ncbi:MAG: copper amine oxidase N-terminal domain-containing protein [Candidatus Xenobia bacterium]